ncbi:MAG: hypothetical protein BGO13_02530 [Burkholderiales bacterium 66-5]|nr:MAG: hypothetical protein BGO13_02530 [Burkholderiales bacterium 66-5]
MSVSVAEALQRAAADGQPAHLSPQLARALLQADPADVVVLLGLDRASRIRRRNAALLRAAALVATDGCGAWVAAGRLAKAIRRFERYRWPALLAGAQPDLSEVEQALHEAFATGATPLTCQRRLHELLRSD